MPRSLTVNPEHILTVNYESSALDPEL